MASRRSRPGDLAARTGSALAISPRICDDDLPLPRYVIAKPLANGATGFYFNVPTRYRKLGCTIPNEPLGNDYAVACGVDGKGGRAAALNGLFDEWWTIRNGEPVESIARYGTVDWLFREYKASKRYRERVSPRTRQDYERMMQLVLDCRRSAAIALVNGRSSQSRRSRPIRFTSRLCRPARSAASPGRESRRAMPCRLACRPSTAIPTASIVTFPTHGTASPSSGGP